MKIGIAILEKPFIQAHVRAKISILVYFNFYFIQFQLLNYLFHCTYSLGSSSICWLSLCRCLVLSLGLFDFSRRFLCSFFRRLSWRFSIICWWFCFLSGLRLFRCGGFSFRHLCWWFLISSGSWLSLLRGCWRLRLIVLFQYWLRLFLGLRGLFGRCHDFRSHFFFGFFFHLLSWLILARRGTLSCLHMGRQLGGLDWLLFPTLCLHFSRSLKHRQVRIWVPLKSINYIVAPETNSFIMWPHSRKTF